MSFERVMSRRAGGVCLVVGAPTRRGGLYEKSRKKAPVVGQLRAFLTSGLIKFAKNRRFFVGFRENLSEQKSQLDQRLKAFSYARVTGAHNARERAAHNARTDAQALITMLFIISYIIFGIITTRQLGGVIVAALPPRSLRNRWRAVCPPVMRAHA